MGPKRKVKAVDDPSPSKGKAAVKDSPSKKPKSGEKKPDKKPGPVTPRVQFADGLPQRSPAFGIRRVPVTRMDLADADGLAYFQDIPAVADGLIKYYVNAEADLTSFHPLARWYVPPPPMPPVSMDNFERYMDAAGVWSGPVFDDEGAWICPPFFCPTA